MYTKEVSSWASLRFCTFLKFPTSSAPFTANIFTHFHYTHWTPSWSNLGRKKQKHFTEVNKWRYVRNIHPLLFGLTERVNSQGNKEVKGSALRIWKGSRCSHGCVPRHEQSYPDKWELTTAWYSGKGVAHGRVHANPFHVFQQKLKL